MVTQYLLSVAAYWNCPLRSTTENKCWKVPHFLTCKDHQLCGQPLPAGHVEGCHSVKRVPPTPYAHTAETWKGGGRERRWHFEGVLCCHVKSSSSSLPPEPTGRERATERIQEPKPSLPPLGWGLEVLLACCLGGEGQKAVPLEEPVTLTISRGEDTRFPGRSAVGSSRQLEDWGHGNKMGWVDSLEWVLGGEDGKHHK